MPVPQLGKLEGTVLDNQGNPISGATVTIHYQGAFVTSTQSGPTYTVNNPGAIVTGVDVAANLGTTTKTTGAVTSTTINTGGGAGLGTMTNNDRIVYKSPKAAIYLDSHGNEGASNPLTTDANGYWYCWAQIAPYDIIQTATGYGSRLITDITPTGLGDVWSWMAFTGGAASECVWKYSTLRTLTAGKLFVLDNGGGNEVAVIDYAGKLTLLGALQVAGISTLTGNVTIGGTLGVTGATTCAALTASGLITANAGITSAAPFTYSGAAGSFSLTAGSIETADLATNCVVVTRIGTGTADQTTVASSPYASGNYDTGSGKGFDITNASVTFTPASTSSEIVISATVPCENNTAAYFGYVAIRDGSGNILSESGVSDANATNGITQSVHLVYRATGLSGSQTFKLSVQSITGTFDVNNSTHAAKNRTAKIVAMEFKK